VREQRSPAAEIPAPAFRGEPEGESQREDALDPALEDGREADEIDRRDERERLGARS
jgi:hypothetical protein